MISIELLALIELCRNCGNCSDLLEERYESQAIAIYNQFVLSDFWIVAKDFFHDAVRNGLEKEGWVITDDPLKIKAGGADMQNEVVLSWKK